MVVQDEDAGQGERTGDGSSAYADCEPFLQRRVLSRSRLRDEEHGREVGACRDCERATEK